jgi:hypothetical protein
VPVARNRVVESMDDGVIVVDMHGRVVDLNPAAQRSLGYLASQAAGWEAARAFGGWSDLAGLCRDETAPQAESVWGAGDAQQTHDLRCAPVTDHRGSFIGRVIVLRDITASKWAEAASRCARRPAGGRRWSWRRRSGESGAELLVGTEFQRKGAEAQRRKGAGEQGSGGAGRQRCKGARLCGDPASLRLGVKTGRFEAHLHQTLTSEE